MFVFFQLIQITPDYYYFAPLSASHSPLDNLLGPLSVKGVKGRPLGGRGAARGCLPGSHQRSPAASSPLQAAPLIPDARSPAIPATRRRRLAVVVAILVPKSGLVDEYE